MEEVARVTEARLKRDVSEGKIVDFWRTEDGFEFIRTDAISTKESKVNNNFVFSSFILTEYIEFDLH